MAMAGRGREFPRKRGDGSGVPLGCRRRGPERRSLRGGLLQHRLLTVSLYTIAWHKRASRGMLNSAGVASLSPFLALACTTHPRLLQSSGLPEETPAQRGAARRKSRPAAEHGLQHKAQRISPNERPRSGAWACSSLAGPAGAPPPERVPPGGARTLHRGSARGVTAAGHDCQGDCGRKGRPLGPRSESIRGKKEDT